MSMESGIFNNTYKFLAASFEKQFLPQRYFEPEHLLAKRAEAFQTFNLKGFPSVKNEDWRFTNLNKLLGQDFRILNQAADHSFLTPGIQGLNCCKLVFLNGRFVPDLSDPLPEGIAFYDTQAAVSNPIYQEKIGSIASDSENSMLALNTAFFTDFYVLHAKAKRPVDTPVLITHHFSADAGSPQLVPYRMLIIAEELSEFTVIETFQSDAKQPVLVSYVNEIQISEAATVHNHLVNALGENLHLIHHREVLQKRNSIFNNTSISVGEAALIRNDTNCRLSEPGVESNLWGSYIVSNEQHIDNHTLVDHQSPHCNSNELYKGIMMDRSRAVFNGKIFVRQDAQKTNAFQQNNNILLSDQATINSKPQLEIFADDVKCSHGSTAGQFDEEALFYLRTRGIGQAAAKQLLIEGFVSEVLGKITIQELRDFVTGLIRRKLNTENLVDAAEG